VNLDRVGFVPLLDEVNDAADGRIVSFCDCV
ncbi:unnamed protein product, partial [Rotaria sp. Silwood2]